MTNEVPKVRMPVFTHDPAGNAAFVKSSVALLASAAGLGAEQAMLFTAHVARETGWGCYVWNNNFGNIKGTHPQTGRFYVLKDRLGFTDPYRAYDTPADGMKDNVDLIRMRKRYAGAWAKLQAGDHTWYSTLGIEGYYEGPPDPNHPGVHQPSTPATVVKPQQEYDSILARVRALASRP